MFKKPEDGRSSYKRCATFSSPELFFLSGADELVPEDGRDEVYDKIMEEIGELEDELEQELKMLEKNVGYVVGATL